MLPFYFPYTLAPMTIYDIREKLIEIAQPDLATLKLISIEVTYEEKS